MKGESAKWRHGWLDGARQIVSPNHDKRPGDIEPWLIVIHAISLPPNNFGGSGVEDLFSNRLDVAAHPFYKTISDLKVSSHFFIRRDGELIQFVSVDDRAWHAGVSCWNGQERCNDFSVGIELEGCDSMAFQAQQYSTLRDLLNHLKACYPITEVVGHSDIAPGRKTDPGPLFDWDELA